MSLRAAVAAVCGILLWAISVPLLAAGPASAPSSQPSVPSGLYAHQELNQSFNGATGFYNANVDRSYLFFNSEGEVYYDVPRGGADSAHFNWAALKKEKPYMFGTWKKEGLTVRLDHPSAPSEYLRAPQFAVLKDDSIKVGGVEYRKVKPLTDGEKLEGIFSMSTGVNVGNAQGKTAGFVGGSHAVGFTAEGHFLKRGITAFDVSRGGKPVINTAGELADKQVIGSYRVIAPYSIEMKHADGSTVEVFTIFLWPGEDNLLCIDGGVYTQVKGGRGK